MDIKLWIVDRNVEVIQMVRWRMWRWKRKRKIGKKWEMMRDNGRKRKILLCRTKLKNVDDLEEFKRGEFKAGYTAELSHAVGQAQQCK